MSLTKTFADLYQFVIGAFHAKLTESDRSFQQRVELLQAALTDSELCPHDETDYCGCMIVDAFDAYCVFRCCGESWRVGYTIADDGSVTFDGNPVEVIPTMTYPDAPAEDESMQEGLRERNIIPQSVRDRMPEKDFAGKGKSFPIKTPQDVKAAAKSIGRAGSDNYDSETLKRNIIAIAKRKGFAKALPASWQEACAPASGKKKPAKEATAPAAEAIESDPVPLSMTDEQLIEGAQLREATSMIKLISPGWGSSGYYSPQVLQSAAPMFRKGTQMFIDHPTAAEESSRPEGSIKNLGAVLTEDARWRLDHPDGPGLYARAQVMGQFAPVLKDLAPHIGVSIRAAGRTEVGEADGRRGALVKEISTVRSVDFVTAAGRGGKVLDLIESRRSGAEAEGKETTMTEQEIQALQAEVGRLRETNARAAALTAANEQLKAVDLPQAAKDRIAKGAAASVKLAEGAFDPAALKASVNAGITAETAYLRECGSIKPAAKGFAESVRQSSVESLSESESASLVETFRRLGGLTTAQAKSAIHEAR